ncbi:rhodanese-related sulfurtransferase [Kiloniella litopenaei]|uniref:Rhodanese-related sulfurtransferase n=1 Tax=Kiloniella litopenaei TaxID=1549748 RepID=A0A0M2R3L6_9PROT|nr:immunity 53 family protein [Kiloniella litopenaei]KKJ76246.1 rhodanese-related sulfurtransferase [Kiloniella litopenaei]
MVTSQDVLLWIQDWYVRQCDDEWEHSYGVRIDTLDNPGWRVSIDLTSTALGNQSMIAVQTERTDNDWIHCLVIDKQFRGYGGPNNLSEILIVFQNFAQS